VEELFELKLRPTRRFAVTELYLVALGEASVRAVPGSGLRRTPVQWRYPRCSYSALLGHLQDAALCWSVQIHAYVLLPDSAYLLLGAPVAEHLAAFQISLGGACGDMEVSLEVPRPLLQQAPPEVWREQGILELQCELEMLPVALGIVSGPAQWYWSSYACHANGQGNDLLVAHRDYLKLGASSNARRSAYRRLCDKKLDRLTIGLVAQQAVADTVARLR
jgi:hypothetical protein